MQTKGKINMIPKQSDIKVVTVKSSHLEAKLNTLSSDAYEIFNIFFQSLNGRSNDDRVVIIAYKTWHIDLNALEEE